MHGDFHACSCFACPLAFAFSFVIRTHLKNLVPSARLSSLLGHSLLSVYCGTLNALAKSNAE